LRPDLIKLQTTPKTKNKYAFDRQSPDLNPIEYAWTTFGQVLQGGSRYLKRNLEELSNSSDFLKFRPGRVLVSVLRRCETSSPPPAT
jgi:hypothetical protein